MTLVIEVTESLLGDLVPGADFIDHIEVDV